LKHVPPEQESVVQVSLSSHLGTLEHAPFKQASVVQGSPSSHFGTW